MNADGLFLVFFPKTVYNSVLCFKNDKRGEIMITLKHATSGILKECPTGFSFTTFFFGFFVPLFRKDFKWAAIMLVAGIAYGIFLEEMNITAASGIGLSFCFGFYYNEQYIKDMLEKGYLPADEASHAWLVGKKILAPESPMGA